MRDNSIANDQYEPFEYATDTMRHQHNNSDPLMVKQELTTDTDDDNISIATYGTIKDCLDDDLESELNMLSQNDLINDISVSPNKSNRSSHSWNENEYNSTDNDNY